MTDRGLGVVVARSMAILLLLNGLNGMVRAVSALRMAELSRSWSFLIPSGVSVLLGIFLAGLLWAKAEKFGAISPSAQRRATPLTTESALRTGILGIAALMLYLKMDAVGNFVASRISPDMPKTLSFYAIGDLATFGVAALTIPIVVYWERLSGAASYPPAELFEDEPEGNSPDNIGT